MKKKILIIAGDPNSINSEIIFKSWKKINKDIKKKIYLIANRELLIKQLKQLKYSLKIKTIKNLSQNSKADELKLINIDLKFNNPFKVNKELASQYVKKCLNLGHNLSVNKERTGLFLNTIFADKDIPVFKFNFFFLCIMKGSFTFIVTGNL